MRPRILHDLSRHLAIRLEEGIRGGVEENPIPVYLCHPLDLADTPAGGGVGQAMGVGQAIGVGQAGGGAAGALYLSRITPDTRYRQAGTFAEASLGPALPVHVRRYGFWVRVRFVFMVCGGSHEEELGALTGGLQALAALPVLGVAEVTEDPGSVSPEVETLPIEIVDDVDVWREIGMSEHRLAVVFDVSVPLASTNLEAAPKVVDRELELEIEIGGAAKAGEA